MVILDSGASVLAMSQHWAENLITAQYTFVSSQANRNGDLVSRFPNLYGDNFYGNREPTSFEVTTQLRRHGAYEIVDMVDDVCMKDLKVLKATFLEELRTNKPGRYLMNIDPGAPPEGLSQVLETRCWAWDRGFCFRANKCKFVHEARTLVFQKILRGSSSFSGCWPCEYGGHTHVEPLVPQSHSAGERANVSMQKSEQRITLKCPLPLGMLVDGVPVQKRVQGMGCPRPDSAAGALLRSLRGLRRPGA